MTKLVLHIGLHKTGTTSIQYVCNSNRHILHEESIVYPDNNDLTLGAQMHLGLTGNPVDIAELMNICSESASKYDYVFMSNEGFFSKLSAMDDLEFTDFIHCINCNFEDVVWVISVRNDSDLLKSAAREFIESSSFPINGIDDMLNNYINSLEKASIRLMDKNVILVDIDADRGALNWPSYFLSKVFCKDIKVPDAHENSTKNKNFAWLLGSLFRAFYANVFDKNLYSNEVREAVERATAEIYIGKEFESKFNSDLNSYLSERVANMISKAGYVSVKDRFR